MHRKRILLSLTVVSLVFILAAGASAQSSPASKHAVSWAKWFKAGASSATDLSDLRQFQQEISGDHGGAQLRLEGTWQISQIFSPGDEDPSLYTFSAGADADNGTVVMSDSFIFTASPSCISAQGAWKRIGDRSFLGTQKAFCFDPDNGFLPAGYITWRYAVTLSEDGSSLFGRELLQLFDLDGNLLAGGPAALQGTRMEAQLPPQ